MNYKAITVSTTTEGAELVSDLFFTLGGQGVCVIDSNDIKELYKGEIIWDYIDESVFSSSPIVKVTGYTDEIAFDSVLEGINKGLEDLKSRSPFALGSLELSVSDVDADDWFNSWKKFYQPIEVDEITILPVWQKYDGNGKVVRIDPGMAFGTGEHESTKMCLKLLQRIDVSNKSIADIGCGSGILGIASLKLGAKKCYFSDIDAIALNNLVDNLRINNVEEFSTYERASLADGNPPVADLVFANITADILIMLSNDIPKLLHDGSYVILSGIIKERENEVLSAYEKVGLKLLEKLEMKDWRGVLFIKE